MKFIIALSFLLMVGGAAWADDPASQMKNAATDGMNKAKTELPKVPEANKGSMLNLNTASQADLEKLPGVGPVKAKAIIAARPFNSVDELTKVKGIKEATVAKLKAFVTVK